MSEHSKAWEKKMAELDQKENELKDELSLASRDLSQSVKNVALMTLVAGVVTLSLYSLYRLFVGSKKTQPLKEEQIEVKKAQSPSPSGGIKNIIIERIVVTLVTYIGTLLTGMLLDPKKKGGLKDS